jgi:hypothetical protein
MRFIELDLRARSLFTLVGVLTRSDAFGEFELFQDVHITENAEKYLRIKYSMDDYRKEGACGRLVFVAEDWRTTPGRGANRNIHIYACSPAPSWYNDVPAKAAGRGTKVRVESMFHSPVLELSYYAAMGNIVQENGTTGFLV